MAYILSSSRVIRAGGYIFNPHAQMEAQIAEATKIVASTFSNIDAAIGKGKSISSALKGSRQQIQQVFHRVIATSRLSGFQQATKITKKNMKPLYGHEIRADAEARASEVGKLMRRTSKRVLNNTPDSDYILSRDRSLSSVRFEASNSYFKGVSDGFAGTGYSKEWLASDSCGECLDNEEQGLIDVDEDFQSGHSYPLAHQNCTCGVRIARMQ